MVHTCDIKNKQIYHYLLLEDAVKLHQLSPSFQVNFSRGFKSSSGGFMMVIESKSGDRVAEIHPFLTKS